MTEGEREEFVKWLEEQVQRAGGARAAASKVGVSHGTILRGLEGEPLSLTTLEGISEWTGVDLVRLLRLYGAQIDDEQRVESALARVLDEYPQLRETFEMALEDLDDEALADVIQFIEFRAQQGRRT